MEGLGSTRNVLTMAIKCIKRGYIGSKRKNDYGVLHKGPVDLMDHNNALSIVMQIHGIKEPFSTKGTLQYSSSKFVNVQPRWFYYGMSTEIKLGYQLEVVREVMGIRPRGRKRDNDENPMVDWKGWFLNNNSNYQPTIDTICECRGINDKTIRDFITYTNNSPVRVTRQRLCELNVAHTTFTSTSSPESPSSPSLSR